MLCAECNQVLPDGSQFCSSCGTSMKAPVVPSSVADKSKRRHTPLILVITVTIALFALVAAAFVFQDSEVMQQMRRSVSSEEQRSLGDSILSLAPGRFSSHKFVIPSGVSDVVVSGNFMASSSSPDAKGRGTTSPEASIEVYVLSEAAFAVWRNGYSGGSEYESGQRTQGTIKVPLPSEAGIYYLVFSNRLSPRMTTVRADITLSYKSWLPKRILTLKDRFINWLNQ